MKIFIIMLFGLLLDFSAQAIERAALESGTLPQVIAFGSCHYQHSPGKHWEVIGQDNPDLFIWLGDVIYADKAQPAKRRSEYKKLLDNGPYQQFIKEVPVLGTWDDHDFYDNDTGKESLFKKESQEMFLDFLGIPKNDDRRKREGIYTSVNMGERLKIIILDLRYFRDSSYVKKKGKTILGKAQWKWLENEIKNSKELNLIVSSNQFISNANGEHWGLFPEDKKRLTDLMIKQRKAKKNFVILTGDRHFAEFTKMKKGSYEFFELSSSGLTHAKPEFVGPGEFRIGPPYAKPNYGLLKFHWKKKSIDLKMEIRNIEGGLVHSLPLHFERFPK